MPDFQAICKEVNLLMRSLELYAKYAKENNIIVIGKYIDIAKSGKNDDRPQFQKMIVTARMEGMI